MNSARLTPAALSQEQQALIALVGITASWRKRRFLRRYLSLHCDYDVFVPDLPYRRSLREVAAWYSDYLLTTVRPERYDTLHCIAYIGAELLLRGLPSRSHLAFARMVCFRSPYQELVAAKLVERIGRWLTQLVAGRTALDLADGWPRKLPLRRHALHEALIVEEGRSRMARWLGISASDIPPESWSATQLLPTAEAVLHVPQSHDDVYTAVPVLDAALDFIQHGEFPVTRA